LLIWIIAVKVKTSGLQSVAYSAPAVAVTGRVIPTPGHGRRLRRDREWSVHGLARAARLGYARQLPTSDDGTCGRRASSVRRSYR